MGMGMKTTKCNLSAMHYTTDINIKLLKYLRKFIQI